MAFQFPASPSLGDTFSPIAGVTYTWDGTGWALTSDNIVTQAEGDVLWMRLDGDNMPITGSVVLERSDGAFLYFSDPGNASGFREAGIEYNGAVGMVIGNLSDDRATSTESITFDHASELIRTFGANGFRVSHSNAASDVFQVDDNGIVGYPASLDVTPFWVINGANFHITRNGMVQSNQTIAVGGQAYGTGKVDLAVGSATHSGYVEFYNPANSRLGFIGLGLAGSKLQFVNEASAGWGFKSGVVSIANDTNDSNYNNSLLSVNPSTGVGLSGIAVHNVSGGGANLTALATIWNNSVVGSIVMTAGGTTYNTTSDARLKKDVNPLVAVGDIIDALKPVTFKWKQNDTPGVGFIAQEVYKTVPEAVTKPAELPHDVWQLDVTKLVPYLVAELKQLRKRVSLLEVELASLVNRG